MILMSDKDSGYSILADAYVLPASHVSYWAGLSIKAYINSTQVPTATIMFRGTKKLVTTSTVVSSFSSRGPSLASPGILKPDITGPRVSILTGWTVYMENKIHTKLTFNIISGTSLSCPLLSGIAALLNHWCSCPRWSRCALTFPWRRFSSILWG